MEVLEMVTHNMLFSAGEI